MKKTGAKKASTWTLDNGQLELNWWQSGALTITFWPKGFVAKNKTTPEPTAPKARKRSKKKPAKK